MYIYPTTLSYDCRVVMVVVFGLESGTFKDSDDLATQLQSLISDSTIDQFCVEVCTAMLISVSTTYGYYFGFFS